MVLIEDVYITYELASILKFFMKITFTTKTFK